MSDAGGMRRFEYRNSQGGKFAVDLGPRGAFALASLDRGDLAGLFELAAGDDGPEHHGRREQVTVSAEARAELRRDFLRRHRTEVLELAERIDPEPGDEQVRQRMKEANLSYSDAASAVFTEWEERREQRERELSAAGPTEPTDAMVRERMSRTGESYDAAAVALSVELGDADGVA